MHHDYFLTHRAHQIQRLRSGADGNRLEIPDRNARAGYPRPLLNLFRSIDRICALPLGEPTKGGLLSRWRLSSLLPTRQGASRDGDSEQGATLREADRALIAGFETDLVRLRMSDDHDTANVAGRVMNAILVDHEFFYGLKPLLHLPDEIAYEFMYPTWFNLYTAMIQTAPAGGEIRLEAPRQAAVFAYLEQWKSRGRPSEALVVGLMTLLINRLPPTEAAESLQRLMDLCDETETPRARHVVANLESLRDRIVTASELESGVIDALVVLSCRWPGEVRKKFDVAGTKILRCKIPTSILERLEQLESKGDEGVEDVDRLRRHLRSLIVDVGTFEPRLVALLDRHPDQLFELLELVTPDDRRGSALSRQQQLAVIKVAENELRGDGRVDVERVRPFARHLAARVSGFSGRTWNYFQGELVQKEKNRRLLLDSCRDDSGRARLASRLIQLASKSDDVGKFLNLLSIAAAVSPDHDASRLGNFQLAIQVLQSSVDEQSIGRNELMDLITDLRTNLPASLEYLVRPLGAAADKPERLSRLYLALNEECEVCRHSGRVSNFGVTRAGYSHLSQLAGDPADDADNGP